MAFSDNKITVADLTGKGVTGMADTPNLSTAQMQQKLDEIAKEVIPPKFNALCDDLDATDFASIITSKSTDKMLFQRLNEYDQMEYSVDNVNWSLIASGKEVLDPTLEADNAKKLGGQLPSFYQKTTDNNLPTTDKTTSGAIAEIKTGLDNVDTTANEAPTYNATLTYAVGDYVSYEKHIYKCNTAIETAEAWNATHWTQVTLANEIETVNNSLTIHSTTFDNVASHVVGDYVINNESDVLYLYKFTSAGTALTSAVKVMGGVGVIVNSDGKAYVMGADSALKKCSSGITTIDMVSITTEWGKAVVGQPLENNYTYTCVNDNTTIIAYEKVVGSGAFANITTSSQDITLYTTSATECYALIKCNIGDTVSLTTSGLSYSTYIKTIFVTH